jgi:hypothetical protein
MRTSLKIQDLTHAHTGVDSIYAAEERGLPEGKIIVARRQLNWPVHLLTKGLFRNRFTRTIKRTG